MPAILQHCPICGPKLSIFCMIMSGWGIIFLCLLGIFFFTESSMLFNSLPSVNKTSMDETHWVHAVQGNYKHCAYNCWIAAALFAVTLVASFWQNKWKSSSPMN